jgi:hypothetical protein
MKKKTALFLCLILLISTIGTGCSSKKDAIRFGAADIGGIYYTFANAYAGLVNLITALKQRRLLDLRQIYDCLPTVTLISVLHKMI